MSLVLATGCECAAKSGGQMREEGLILLSLKETLDKLRRLGLRTL